MKSVGAHLLMKEFHPFCKCASPVAVAQFPGARCTQAMRLCIGPVKKFAHTVHAHRKLLNCFRAKKQFSSGVIEGRNRESRCEKSA